MLLEISSELWTLLSVSLLEPGYFSVLGTCPLSAPAGLVESQAVTPRRLSPSTPHPVTSLMATYRYPNPDSDGVKS